MATLHLSWMLWFGLLHRRGLTIHIPSNSPVLWVYEICTCLHFIGLYLTDEMVNLHLHGTTWDCRWGLTWLNTLPCSEKKQTTHRTEKLEVRENRSRLSFSQTCILSMCRNVVLLPILVVFHRKGFQQLYCPETDLPPHMMLMKTRPFTDCTSIGSSIEWVHSRLISQEMLCL